MSGTADGILLAALILTTSVWVGGYVAIAVVARAATETLDPAARVDFFGSLGRSYLRVGVPALVLALGTGAMLARDHKQDALLVSMVVVAAVLVACLVVAVVQARRMSALRRRALGSPGDEELAERVRRGGRVAGMLRAALGLLSFALVVLGSLLAT